MGVLFVGEKVGVIYGEYDLMIPYLDKQKTKLLLFGAGKSWEFNLI
jgi:hypothetical protein